MLYIYCERKYSYKDTDLPISQVDIVDFNVHFSIPGYDSRHGTVGPHTFWDTQKQAKDVIITNTKCLISEPCPSLTSGHILVTIDLLRVRPGIIAQLDGC